MLIVRKVWIIPFCARLEDAGICGYCTAMHHFMDNLASVYTISDGMPEFCDICRIFLAVEDDLEHPITRCFYNLEIWVALKFSDHVYILSPEGCFI